MDQYTQFAAKGHWIQLHYSKKQQNLFVFKVSGLSSSIVTNWKVHLSIEIMLKNKLGL